MDLELTRRDLTTLAAFMQTLHQDMPHNKQTEAVEWNLLTAAAACGHDVHVCAFRLHDAYDAMRIVRNAHENLPGGYRDAISMVSDLTDQALHLAKEAEA